MIIGWKPRRLLGVYFSVTASLLEHEREIEREPSNYAITPKSGMKAIDAAAVWMWFDK